jgi:hypothetical protein
MLATSGKLESTPRSAFTAGRGVPCFPGDKAVALPHLISMYQVGAVRNSTRKKGIGPQPRELLPTAPSASSAPLR